MITKRKRNIKNKTKKILHKSPKISSNFDSGSIKILSIKNRGKKSHFNLSLQKRNNQRRK